jgi:DNA-binding CsgD family transcriptional regulator
MEITHPEDREIGQKRLEQALTGELAYFWLDQRYVHGDGHEVWCYISCTLLRDWDRSPLYFVAHFQDISERIRSREQLRETNTALKVLLDGRDRDQAEKEREITAALENLVCPYLEKLQATPLDREQRTYVDLIRDNLDDIASPLVHGLATLEKRLTPTEFQVADLVRRGKTSQEIGELLRMSDAAVFFHRNNIRQKLGLRHSRINLRSHLAGLD